MSTIVEKFGNGVSGMVPGKTRDGREASHGGIPGQNGFS